MSLRLQNEGQKKLTDSTDAHGVFDTDFFDLFSSFDLFSDFDFSLDCALTGQGGFQTDFGGKKKANIIF